MVLCKFWAQGYCRYGNKCRFEHETPRNNYRDDYRNNRQNYTNSNQINASNFPNNNVSRTIHVQKPAFSFTKAVINLQSNQQDQHNKPSFSFSKALLDSQKNANLNLTSPQFNTSRHTSSQDIEMDNEQQPITTTSFNANPFHNLLTNQTNQVVNQSSSNNNISLLSQSNDKSSFFQNTNLQRQATQPIIQQQLHIQQPNVQQPNQSSNSLNLSAKQSSCYSNLSDLTEFELKQYEDDKFTFPNIPLKPPPEQLCR